MFVISLFMQRGGNKTQGLFFHGAGFCLTKQPAFCMTSVTVFLAELLGMFFSLGTGQKPSTF